MGLLIESVKATFSVLKKYPKILIISLVVMIPSFLQSYFQDSLSTTYKALLALLIMFISLIYSALATLIVRDALSSKRIYFRKLLSASLEKLYRLFGLMVLFLLIGLVMLIPIIVPAMYISTVSWTLVLLTLFSSILIIYVFTRLTFSIPIIMIKDSGIIESIKKSWQASNNKFWSIFGAFVLLSLLFITLLIPILISIPFFIVFDIRGYVPLWFTITYLLVSLALSIVPSVLITFLPAAYYLKIKRRK